MQPSPLRTSMRSSLSPYKRSSVDSPITKTKYKDAVRKMSHLEEKLRGKQIDYYNLGTEYENVRADLGELKDKFKNLSELLEIARNERDAYLGYKDDYEAARNEANELQKEVQRLSDAKKTLQETVNDYLKDFRHVDMERNKDLAEKEKLKSTNEVLVKRVADLEDELLEMRSECERLQRSVTETQNSLFAMHRDFNVMKETNREMARMSVNFLDIQNLQLENKENHSLGFELSEVSLKEKHEEMMLKFEEEKAQLQKTLEKQKEMLQKQKEENVGLQSKLKQERKEKVDIQKKFDEAKSQLELKEIGQKVMKNYYQVHVAHIERISLACQSELPLCFQKSLPEKNLDPL